MVSRNGEQSVDQRRPALRAGYTLIELLIVVSLIGILAGIVLPRFEPGVHDQLRSAGQVVWADLAYARDLAVTNNSNYQVVFNLPGNQYRLRHSGANAQLDQLPRSPFASGSDPSGSWVTDFDELPYTGPAVTIAAVQRRGAGWATISSLEFGPLGQLTTPGDVRIWLACGAADQRRYVPLEINAITGLTSIGDYQATGPSGGGS